MEKSKFKSQKHSSKPTQPLTTTSTLPTSNAHTSQGTAKSLTQTMTVARTQTRTKELNDLTTVSPHILTDLTMVGHSHSHAVPTIDTNAPGTEPANRQTTVGFISQRVTSEARASASVAGLLPRSTKSFYTTKSTLTTTKKQTTSDHRVKSTYKPNSKSDHFSSPKTDATLSLNSSSPHSANTRPLTVTQITTGTKRNTSAVTAAPGKDTVSSAVSSGAAFTGEDRKSTFTEPQGYVSIGTPVSQSSTVPSIALHKSTRPFTHTSPGPPSDSSTKKISAIQSTQNIVPISAHTYSSVSRILTTTIHNPTRTTKTPTKNITEFPGIPVQLPSNKTNITDIPTTVTSRPGASARGTIKDITRLTETSTKAMDVTGSTTAAPPVFGALKQDSKLGIVGSLVLWFFYAQGEQLIYFMGGCRKITKLDLSMLNESLLWHTTTG